MQKFKKSKVGIETREITNYTEDILNDPSDFDPKTFRTKKLDDGTMAVYGVRKKDGKKILHKLQTPRKK